MNIRKIFEEYEPNALEDSEEMYKLKSIINNLDPADKALFILYTDLGSIYKVGKLLKVHPTTVYNHLQRIKKQITNRYEAQI